MHWGWFVFGVVVALAIVFFPALYKFGVGLFKKGA
jgi:hypothetical protein